MKNDLFKCYHRKLRCFMGYERCSGSCSHYGECIDCKSWFIPAGQYPCNKCKYLDVKPPK